MLNIKPGVRVSGMAPEILIAVIVANDIYTKAGVPCVITSCTDGSHKTNSLHYCGMAVDLRTRDLPVASLPVILEDLKFALGPDYDVVLESDHIHIEHDED